MHDIKTVTLAMHHRLQSLTKQISHDNQSLELAINTLASSQDQKIMGHNFQDLKSHSNVIDDSINFQEDLVNHTARIVKFNPKKIITEFAALYRSNKEITMNVVYPEEDLEVFGILLNLRRILANIFSNAEKFTLPKGKIITIILTYPKSVPTKSRVCLKFSVKDNGQGMKQKAMKRIFTPYAQGGKEISSQYGGTGLGLPGCKTLIEQMGGKISVSSVFGKGSTFTFTMICHRYPPIKKMQAPIAPPASVQSILDSMHDVRNVTGWLISYSGFIKEPIQALKKLSIPVTDIEKSAQAIEDCAESQRHLITQTLDYSKLVLKKSELHMINFKPTEIISDIISPYQKKIAITTDYPKENKHLCGDAEKLKRIFVSLIHYAINLKIKKINIHFAYTDSPLALEFKVVFAANLDSKHDDTDLNFQVYQELIKLMTGCMSTALTKAALIFSFQIPYQPYSPKLSTDKTRSLSLKMPTAKKTRILVVDDQIINRFIVKKQLNGLGYQSIIEADSGEQALNIYTESKNHNPPFDIIFMDIQMPGMDGIETTRQIRAREQKQQQKKSSAYIVALSGNESRETQNEAKAAGMDEFLFKPIDVHQLQQAISHIHKPKALAIPKSRSDNLSFFRQQQRQKQLLPKPPLKRSVSNPTFFGSSKQPNIASHVRQSPLKH